MIDNKLRSRIYDCKNKIDKLEKEKKYDEAILILDKYIKRKPYNVWGYEEKARIFKALGLEKEASEILVIIPKRESIAPNDCNEKKLNRLNRFIRQYPHNYCHYSDKALLLGKLGRLQEAIEVWRQAKELFPDSPAELILIGLSTGGAEKIIKLIRG